jgi:hypothetical protein
LRTPDSTCFCPAGNCFCSCSAIANNTCDAGGCATIAGHLPIVDFRPPRFRTPLLDNQRGVFSASSSSPLPFKHEGYRGIRQASNQDTQLSSLLFSIRRPFRVFPLFSRSNGSSTSTNVRRLGFCIKLLV